MKIRYGFVSNSSSSSFICDVTGDMKSGMDMSLEDAGMYSCKNGHTFLEKFLLPKNFQTGDERTDLSNYILRYIKNIRRSILDQKTLEELRLMKLSISALQTTPDEDEEYEDEDEEDEDESYDARYETDPFRCPICQFVQVKNDELLFFLLFKYGLSKQVVLAEMKNNYGSWKNFNTTVLVPTKKANPKE